MKHVLLEDWYAAKLASVADAENKACRKRWDHRDPHAFKNCGKVSSKTLDLALELSDGPKTREALTAASILSPTTTRDRLSDFCQRGIAKNISPRGQPGVYVKGPNWSESVRRWAEHLGRVVQ